MSTKNVKRKNIATLTECAVLVALSFVLSLIKVWQMPLGGSVTLLSMLPVCIAVIRHGNAWGFGTAFVYSLTQAFVSGAVGWGLSVKVLLICYLFDYVLAYTVLGFAGVFRKHGVMGAASGIALACLLRFLCHFITGVTIWGSSALGSGHGAAVFSLIYNGQYMLPETVFTVIGGTVLIRALSKRGILTNGTENTKK